MAVRKKEEQASLAIPKKLDDMLLQGFSFQAITAKYKDAFDEVKDKVKTYLETNDDDFNVDMGKGFKCAQGTVIFQERSNYAYDKDKLIALIEAKQVTLATILELANFPAEKLQVALGEKNFKSLSTLSTTQSLTIKATTEFKASVDEKFASVLPEEAKPTRPVKVDVKAEMATDKAKDVASAARAKAPKAKAKTPTKDVDSDLESILKS